MKKDRERPAGGTFAIPRIIAHRGASRDRPENTLSAFEEALRQDCDGIEIDLQLSRDGIPVVFHDQTLARAGRPAESIAQHPLACIRQLDVGIAFGREFRGLGIPTFGEVLERFSRRTCLLVEIKIWGTLEHRLALLEAALEEVDRQAAKERIFILCYDLQVLEVCAAIAPGLPRVLNVRPPAQPDREWQARLENLSAVSASVRTLTPRFGAAVRREGRPLIVFSCNTPKEVDRALEAGAAGIMTDRPGWLAARLRNDEIGQ